MTCDARDMTDFADSVEEQIELALEEGAEPVEIAAAMIFVLGQFLLDYETTEVVVDDLKAIVDQTEPVLAQFEADGGYLH